MELVPRDNFQLKALLQLTKACQSNDFSILDESVTVENIKEFVDWQTSITPEDPWVFSKHLSELYNL